MRKQFEIRSYPRSQLAMLYFPEYDQRNAWRNFKRWLEVNPRLRGLLNMKGRTYTPRQVKNIVKEIGTPSDYE